MEIDNEFDIQVLITAFTDVKNKDIKTAMNVIIPDKMISKS